MHDMTLQVSFNWAVVQTSCCHVGGTQ